MLMFITNTWTAGAMESTVIFYALAFGGTGQLIAGVLDVSFIKIHFNTAGSMRFVVSVSGRRIMFHISWPHVCLPPFSSNESTLPHASSLCTADQGQHVWRYCVLQLRLLLDRLVSEGTTQQASDVFVTVTILTYRRYRYAYRFISLHTGIFLHVPVSRYFCACITRGNDHFLPCFLCSPRGGQTYSKFLYPNSFVSPSPSGLQLYFGLWAVLTLSESYMHCTLN